MPKHLEKDGCVYMPGVIEKSAHGFYHITLENGMDAICTARKMDVHRISLLEGDSVTVEIPMMSLSPNEKIKGRVVWRTNK